MTNQPISDWERNVFIDFMKFSHLGIQNWWNHVMNILQVRPFGHYEKEVLFVFLMLSFCHVMLWFDSKTWFLSLLKHRHTSVQRYNEIFTIYNSFNQSQGSTPFESDVIGWKMCTKGQLISEWNFGVFKSPKKPTKF